MTVARDIMNKQTYSIDVTSTVMDAARKMAEHKIGALPICDKEQCLQGVVTDRDIVVQVLAQGRDPGSVKVSELCSELEETVTIGADDSLDEAVQTMMDHKVRRLPVIDGHTMVGMISQGDLAMHIDEKQAGQLLQKISEAP